MFNLGSVFLNPRFNKDLGFAKPGFRKFCDSSLNVLGIVCDWINNFVLALMVFISFVSYEYHFFSGEKSVRS